MPLGVIFRVSFGFGVFFGDKSQKGKTGKFGIFTFLRRIVGNPCRGEVGVQKWPPRVRYDVALLCRSGGLSHSVEVLLRGVDTVHTRKLLDSCFRKSRICTPIV